MKKLITLTAVAVTLIISLSACSGKKRNADTETLMEQQSSMLTEALLSNDYTTASSLADSMALYVDDLTPDETVTVLLAFLEIHNRAALEGRHDDDLETLRKYVDVYDIAVGANPNDMRAAFSAARSRNSEVDFEQAAREFRRALAEYDAVRTYGEEPKAQSAPTDSAATDSVQSSISSSTTTLAID